MGDIRARRGHFRVVFDDAWWHEDLRHLTALERLTAQDVRQDAEQHGLWPAVLYRCDPEARDGTRLGGCVKQYAGELRVVYAGAIDSDGRPYLRALACGRGHRPRTDHRPTVYEIADRRLNP